MCQAFSCTPLEAWRQPVPMVRDTLEARSFAEAYRQVEEFTGADGQTRPSGPMVEAVMECEAEALAQLKESRGL